MRLTRRALLAAPVFAAPAVAARPAAAATMAMLRPGARTALGFVPLPGERLALRADGLGLVTLPAVRARLHAVLPLAGRQVVALAFGADAADGSARLDLVALIGWDGACLRVLALEVLLWRGPAGAMLDTRVSVTPDASRLLLRRDTAMPKTPTLWRREHWTDWLAWQPGGPLANVPVRPPLPGTWQAWLAARRARVAARLATPCQSIGDDLIALATPADPPVPG